MKYVKQHAYRVMVVVTPFDLNICGNMSMLRWQNFCGLAAAVFVVDVRRSKLTNDQFETPRMSQQTTKSPWKMKRDELADELVKMGCPVRPDWTVPELRSLLIEKMDLQGDQSHKTKGITHMCLQDLTAKCLEEGLALPPKPTRGLLMRMLRENTPPGDTEKVCFGSYKGYMYKEVNPQYLEWAMREVAANPQHSPDLARLAQWAQARQTRPPPAGAASGSGDPEQSPSLPVPEGALPKAKAKVKGDGKKQQRVSRTRTMPEDSSSYTVVSEAEVSLDEEIKDMETRLHIMKAAKEAEKKRLEAGLEESPKFSTPGRG